MTAEANQPCRWATGVAGRVRRSVQALAPYTPGEQPRTPGLIKLNTNENPYPPSPKVRDALREFAPNLLRLYPDPLAARLRAAIASLHGCSMENVFVGNGSDEILALCTRAFVEPDGLIAWYDPSYSLYPVLASIADVRGAAIPLTEDFDLPPPGPIEASVSLLFITTPNAPTGRAFARSVLERVCDSSRGVVVLDEAYADFASESFADLAISRPNVVITRSFSKSYSLAGLRLGYALGPSELIEALFKIKDSYNVDALAQLVGEAAINDQEWMRENARKIIATRERVRQALASRGWRVVPSATNFLFASPPDGNAKTVFASLRAQNILVRYFPGDRTGNFLRITIGTDAEMDALLAAIDKTAASED